MEPAVFPLNQYITRTDISYIPGIAGVIPILGAGTNKKIQCQITTDIHHKNNSKCRTLVYSRTKNVLISISVPDSIVLNICRCLKIKKVILTIQIPFLWSYHIIIGGIVNLPTCYEDVQKLHSIPELVRHRHPTLLEGKAQSWLTVSYLHKTMVPNRVWMMICYWDSCLLSGVGRKNGRIITVYYNYVYTVNHVVN